MADKYPARPSERIPLMIDRTSLYRQLQTLSSEEQYLKSCYEAGTLPLNHYTYRLPPENPVQLTEEMFFPAASKQNIIVLKHQCYSPAFPHSHDFFEIFYVLKGQSRHEISSRHSGMKRGDFCMIPPGTLHNIQVVDDSIIIDILIRKSAFENVFSNLLDSNNILTDFFTCNIYTKGANDYIIFHTGEDEELQNLILDMYLESDAKDSYYEMLLDTQLSMLFGRLLRSYESSCELPPFTSRTDSQMFGMIQYLHQNYQNISLKDLAKQFHYTPEYTSKLIHDAAGQTFSALLAQIRMEQAIRLLRSTSLTVGEVGLKCGYSTPEHFIRTFRRMYKCTPNEYRKSCRP